MYKFFGDFVLLNMVEVAFTVILELENFEVVRVHLYFAQK